MSPVELLEKASNKTSHVVADGTATTHQIAPALIDDEDELLIEEISIDGMCGVY